MNLYNLNHLFADYEGHFAFGEIMSKIGSNSHLPTLRSMTILITKRIGNQIVLQQCDLHRAY